MAKKSLLLLNTVKSLSSKVEEILSYFSDPEEIVSATRKELETLSFLTPRERDALLKLKQSGFLDQELNLLEKKKYKVVDICDPQYPPLLREIPSPPPVLYVKGNIDVLHKLCVAIVGTRLPTLYGVEMAGKFSSGLARLKCAIVSGLARGIDTIVHKAALETGFTIAVLGSGLCALYPKENKALAEKISEKGAVVSEFPLNAPPLKENFPRRNRIISGLSRGVVIIEAPLRSGSLITARYATEHNRELFALPGKVNSPMSKGAHWLIKQGARLIDSLEDIVQELQIHFKCDTFFSECNPQEKVILDIIGQEGVTLEEIMIRSSLKREVTTKSLLTLQMKGLIKELRPLYFTKADI